MYIPLCLLYFTVIAQQVLGRRDDLFFYALVYPCTLISLSRPWPPLALSSLSSDLPLVCLFPPDLFSALSFISLVCNWIFGTVYRKLPLVFPVPWVSHAESVSLPVLSCCAFLFMWSSGSPAWSASSSSLVSLFSPYLFFMIQLQISTPPPCHTLLQTHLRSLSELDSSPALASRFPVQSPLVSLTSLAYRLPHPSLFAMSLQIWICC